MPIENAGGVNRLDRYNPEIYHPMFMEEFRDRLFMNRLCNRDYEGTLKQSGDKVWLRKRPTARTQRYRKGMVLPHVELEAASLSFTVNRARFWAFKIDILEKELTDMKGFTSDVTDEFDNQLAEDIETEFLADIYARCSVENMGNTAGHKSASYDLGSAANPLGVYKTAQTTQYKAAAVDAVAAAAAALEEQPGGMGVDPFIVIPVAMGLRIQTGELKKANESGDSTTLMRKGVTELGKIAGLTVYTSNLISVVSQTVGGVENTKCYNILFGDKKGITYADQIVTSEVKPIENGFGNKFQALHVYDWASLYPTRIGAMYVYMG
jgi:hypothetical protein